MVNNDVKQAVGNMSLTISTACFVYVFIGAETDMSLYLSWDRRWFYLAAAVVLLVVGVLLINSKTVTEMDKMRYVRTEGVVRTTSLDRDKVDVRVTVEDKRVVCAQSNKPQKVLRKKN